MARKTQAAKGRELLKVQFPAFNYMDYENSLRHNLNFYNTEFSNGDKKDWCIEFWKDAGKNVVGLGKVDEFYFSSVGALIHMLHHRDIALYDEHKAAIETKYEELMGKVKEKKEEAPEKPKTERKVVDRSDEFIAECEFFIDEFHSGKVHDPRAYLTKVEVKPHEAKRMVEWFKKRVDELNEVENDAELQEAYYFNGKRAFNKYRDYVVGIYDACSFFASVKTERKPRTTKPKPPSFVVRKVQYLKEIPELKMKSVHPEKLVDTESIWVYSNKLRRLYRYTALAGQKMTIKGTTIMNFDPEKSGSKILRKPMEQLQGVMDMTIRPLNKLYGEIKATEGKAVGRLNMDTIIIACFK